ncbi:MAG: hypothetical protein MUC56_07800 [Thermoanaerobaculales bacterium]|jgi:hypothetical protein|nr:hypothetical protein [Thermoanaerobaculales bacterium]
MARTESRPGLLGARLIAVAVAIVTALIVASAVPAAAQDAEWRAVDNPYQEDVAYTIGDRFEPFIAVQDVRWRSFTISAPERDPFAGGQSVDVEVLVEIENRRSSSARILIILLLEDGDGNPLERIEVPAFKVPGSRLRDRSQSATLPISVVEATRRVYLFFEVLE